MQQLLGVIHTAAVIHQKQRKNKKEKSKVFTCICFSSKQKSNRQKNLSFIHFSKYFNVSFHTQIREFDLFFSENTRKVVVKKRKKDRKSFTKIMSDNAASNNKQCSHFSNYLSQYGRSHFTLVNACFSTPINKKARRQKVNIDICTRIIGICDNEFVIFFF